MVRAGIRRGIFLTFTAVLFFLPAPVQSEGAVRYVTQNGAGTRHGSSWANAMGEKEFIGTLRLHVQAGTEFWIAAGTYRPTSDPGERGASFTLQAGVALYGGFTGKEVLRTQRDWKTNETILSGEIQNDGYWPNNSLHVVSAGKEADGTAVIDGFTVTGGWAYGSLVEEYSGGGLANYGSPAVSNCTFRENGAKNGGGMYTSGSGSLVTGCTFEGNRAGEGGGMYNVLGSGLSVKNSFFSGNQADSGGGMYNYYTLGLTVENCSFSGNYSENYGGGMMNSESNPSITGCTFSGNRAGIAGGGMSSLGVGTPVTANSGGDSSPAVLNCTFFANEAGTAGGGMHVRFCSIAVASCTFHKNLSNLVGGDMANLDYSSPAIKNSIFWGSSIGSIHTHPTASAMVKYCVVQGGYAGGTSIITADPKLADPADNGGHTLTCALLAGSSAIDAGMSSGAPPADQRGVSRPQGAGVDIGAFEFSLAPPPPTPSPSPSSGGGCSQAGSVPSLTLLLFLPVLLLMRP